MSLLIPTACMALLAGLLGAAVYPILTSRQAWRRAVGADRTRLELTERKEQLYASLKELEFDHSLGKIADADAEALRADLETRAVEVLRQLDSLDGQDDPASREALDRRIEADIARLRARSTGPAEPAPTPEPVAAHGFCHSCGQPRTPEYRFCPHCGQAFVPAQEN